jgi:hypothetical protein
MHSLTRPTFCTTYMYVDILHIILVPMLLTLPDRSACGHFYVLGRHVGLDRCRNQEASGKADRFYIVSWTNQSRTSALCGPCSRELPA